MRLRREEPLERPGPGAVPPAVLRSLDLAIRRRVDSLVPGEHRTPMVGVGTELSAIRPYVPGDDVRHIDWNVTARMREPHVRVHVAERALVTWLVLDMTPSMRFGTADRLKSDVAEGVALAVGHVASRRGNRLGMVAFSPAGTHIRRPRQGRAGLMALLAELRDQGPPDAAHAGDAPARPHPRAGDTPAAEPAPGEDLAHALRTVDALARQRGLVVVVSDFRGTRDWSLPVRRLVARHGVMTVEVIDPREEQLVPAGDLWLTDPETGRAMRVNTGRRKVRERFAAAAAAERAEVRDELAAAGAEHVTLTTAGDWLQDLALHLRRPRPGADLAGRRPHAPLEPKADAA